MEPSADTSIPAANRELVELAARFASSFARWLDVDTDDGLNYTRLSVLEFIHCRGPARMKDLAEALGLSPRNLTAVADALETDGLIHRAAHPSDRRSTLLELTEAGWQAADRSLEPKLSRIGRLFDELTPTARADLHRSLTVLVEAMDDGSGDACPSAAAGPDAGPGR